ncbi:MAG: cell division protein FtsZ, partial [Methylotenera sp.]|nr:cell division protein FtsZ [Methylotenera sp.]
EVVRNGTTGQPIYIGGAMAGNGMMAEDEAPAVFGSNSRRAQVDAMKNSGMEEYDIPAFLRKQAD